MRRYAKIPRKTVSRWEYDAITPDANIAQELSWALLRGEKPEKHVSGDWAVWVIATHRMHGGLACVVEKTARKRDLCSWTYLDDINPGPGGVSPFIREAANKARASRARV